MVQNTLPYLKVSSVASYWLGKWVEKFSCSNNKQFSLHFKNGLWKKVTYNYFHFQRRHSSFPGLGFDHNIFKEKLEWNKIISKSLFCVKKNSWLTIFWYFKKKMSKKINRRRVHKKLIRPNYGFSANFISPPNMTRLQFLVGESPRQCFRIIKTLNFAPLKQWHKKWFGFSLFNCWTFWERCGT